MTAIAVEKTDWLMRLLALQSPDVKLNLINRLSASLIKERRKKKVDMSFFDELTNAWADGISPEEETKNIREARTSGATRTIEDF